LITDGNSPINLFNTAQGLISTDFEKKWRSEWTFTVSLMWTILFWLLCP
jgi:hypothetical protein